MSEVDEPSRGRTESQPRSLDLEIAAVAGAQRGVISVAQLAEIGLSASAVRGRIATGRLVRVLRGVYALGLPLAPGARAHAALLVAGPGAVLSHQSAAHTWNLLPSDESTVHITAATKGRRQPGVRFHSSSLAATDIAAVDGIPVTALPRTLLDLSTLLPAGRLARAVDRSEQLRLFDLGAVRELLSRSQGHRGSVRLWEAIGGGREPTANELEDAMLRLCHRAHPLPPEVNVWLPFPDGSGVRVDFLWRSLNIAVETDGWATHGTRRAFGTDRARDRRLEARAGVRTYRFTWHEVMLEPARVVQELRSILRRGEVDETSAHGTVLQPHAGRARAWRRPGMEPRRASDR